MRFALNGLKNIELTLKQPKPKFLKSPPKTALFSENSQVASFRQIRCNPLCHKPLAFRHIRGKFRHIQLRVTPKTFRAPRTPGNAPIWMPSTTGLVRCFRIDAALTQVPGKSELISRQESRALRAVPKTTCCLPPPGRLVNIHTPARQRVAIDVGSGTRETRNPILELSDAGELSVR